VLKLSPYQIWKKVLLLHCVKSLQELKWTATCSSSIVPNILNTWRLSKIFQGCPSAFLI
jgi:hypothetical protein